MLKRFVPLVFILLWIVPVAWVGLMRSNYPLYPAWIAPLFRVSGIFESSPSRWRIFFIEAQDSSGWHYVDEKSLFASTPLGNRTRFQQLMNEIGDDHPEQAQKIAAWIGHHLPQADSSVRIIHFGVPSETFLQSPSLADIYKIANEAHMPRIIVCSLNTSSHENP